jgi:hypothetical protein
MLTMYERRSAALLTERMAFSATLLPKLIAPRMIDTTRQTRREFTGTSHPGTTWRIQFENGKPWSLEKLQICRLELATVVTVLKNKRTKRMVPSTYVAASEPVAW